MKLMPIENVDRVLVAEMVRQTRCSENQAVYYLRCEDCNLNRAIETYYMDMRDEYGR